MTKGVNGGIIYLTVILAQVCANPQRRTKNMEKTTEKQEFEFSFISFLKIFKGKLKMLVALGLIAAILGGVVGALTVTVGKKTYGNLLAFYFPTQEQTGYSNVIPLLESDLFTENILIGNKDVDVTDAEGKTVSVSIPDLPYTAEEEAEIAKYAAEKIKLAEDIKSYKNQLNSLPLEIENLKSQLEAATGAYTPLKEELTELWTVYSDVLSADALAKINALESSEKYVTAKDNFLNTQKAHGEKVIEQATASENLFKAERAYKEAVEKSDAIIESLRAEWRKDPANKELIEDFSDYVTYSFTKDGSPLQINNQLKEDTSGKVLYIDVRIPEDIALANKVINNILDNVADFVISNTTPVEKNDQIECMRISSGEAKDVKEDSLIKTALIFAIIFFAAIELITCSVIFCSYLKRTFFPSTEDAATATEDSEKSENSEESTEN